MIVCVRACGVANATLCIGDQRVTFSNPFSPPTVRIPGQPRLSGFFQQVHLPIEPSCLTLYFIFIVFIYWNRNAESREEK